MSVSDLKEAIGVISVIPRLSEEMTGMLSEAENWLIEFQGILANTLGADHSDAGLASNALTKIEDLKGVVQNAQSQADDLIHLLVSMQ